MEDRRVRRTRRLLHEALVGLILEKGYDRVTVQDVLDRADVGRATFYSHFRDKDDLLVTGGDEIRESVRARMAEFIAGRGHDSADGMGVTRIVFDHADKHRRLYRALMGKRGAGVIFRHAYRDLTDLFREHFEQAIATRDVHSSLPLDVTVQFVVSALVSSISWWIESEVPYTAEEMDRMFQQLMRHGVLGALDAQSHE